MNLHKVTPTWYMNGQDLCLSIDYWKPNETSEGYSECSSSFWVAIEDGDFNAAYNRIVDSASKTFDLDCLRKIKVSQNENQIFVVPSGIDFGTFFMIIFVSMSIGIAIGARFF